MRALLHVRASRASILLAAAALSGLAGHAAAQQPAGGRGQAVPPSARATAAIDATGTWVSVITEEWVSRMVTPRKGYVRGGGIHLTPEGMKLTNMWDPARDEAAGEHCKGYGAVGVTRLPGKVRITWEGENTLKAEFEAGNQVRRFYFASAPAPGSPSWQGHSIAQWERAVTNPGERAGNLKVMTTNLRPQYARKNGLPISGNARLTEYLHVLNAPTGDLWLSWIGELDEPLYYLEPYHYSWQFKKVPDNSSWNPEPCSAR
jgi:hypothetical protein